MPDTVVVVASGRADPARAHALVPPGATVVAADGGVDHALALGLHVDVAVGDFDSLLSESLALVGTRGTHIERHPVEKDATDLELALGAALAFEPDRIVVLGDDGGRLDHLLSAALLLATEQRSNSLSQGQRRDTEVDAVFGPALLHVIRSQRQLTGETGEAISLVPVHGPAEGIVTEGLAYPLRRETLHPGSSRGISNSFAEAQARVSLERGVLLAIRPGNEGNTP